LTDINTSDSKDISNDINELSSNAALSSYCSVEGLTASCEEPLDEYSAKIDAAKEDSADRLSPDKTVLSVRDCVSEFLVSAEEWTVFIYEASFRRCYRLGEKISLNFSFLRKAYLALLHFFFSFLPKRIHSGCSWLKNLFVSMAEGIISPYRMIGANFSRFFREIKAIIKKDPKAPRLSLALRHFFGGFSLPLNRISSFIAPVLSILVLFFTVNYFTNLHFALAVEYSGELIGYIEQESDFYSAQESVMARLINEEYIPPEDSIPTFSLAIVPKESVLDARTLTDKVMSSSGNLLTEADGIHIDGVFVGAMADANEFLNYIDSLLDVYRVDNDFDRVNFAEDISVQRGIYPQSSVLSLEEIKQYLAAEDALEETYIVKNGELLSDIAEMYHTSVEQLELYNPSLAEKYKDNIDENGDPIFPVGTEMLVSRQNVTLGVTITRRETYEEAIPYPTQYIEDNSYYENWSVIINYGSKGSQSVTADVTYLDGVAISTEVIDTKVLKEPVPERIKIGTSVIVSKLPEGADTSGSFIWPCDGGWFNGSLQSYPGHTGLDIAASIGTTVRAARGGTVTYATNFSVWPYGRYVIINHGNGVYSRYYHMSKVVIPTGKKVEQGEIIGYVGSSGNSTGPHLHFEIRVNGVIMPPEKYIGYSYYRP